MSPHASPIPEPTQTSASTSWWLDFLQMDQMQGRDGQLFTKAVPQLPGHMAGLNFLAALTLSSDYMPKSLPMGCD